MTRKRNRQNLITPPSVQQQFDPDMSGIAQRLAEEQTGNYGILYPDGRPNIAEIRDFERAAVQPFNDPRVMLPNPVAEAPFDRTEPQDRIAKNQAFGFQVQPDRLIDLPPGDAGAGKSVYRRTQVFARLNGSTSPADPVAGNPFDKTIGMATYRSSDCRPRFWHISFFGIAVQRVANAVPVSPLSRQTILSEQLKPITVGATEGQDFVPAITQMKGRIMAFDESGQRFYDVDILGNRSIDIYAWGVTAFILAPGNFYEGQPNQAAYEVDTTPGITPNAQTQLAGLVEDAIIGIRIVPIVINSTQNVENRTIAVVTPGNTDTTRIPIPPGATKVQVISHETAAIAATYTIRFDAGTDGTFAGRSDMGIIDINAGQSRSDVVLIPNSVQILITPPPGNVSTAGWSLIFTVESQ